MVSCWQCCCRLLLLLLLLGPGLSLQVQQALLYQAREGTH
jgi:hypothetical protein